jgi:hypothetical protein
MSDLPRLVVGGGSCADGFGVEPWEAYAALVGESVGTPPTLSNRHGVRMRDIADALRSLDLSSRDVLLLHLGVTDSAPRMPRHWYALVKASRRGRGRMEPFEADRRLWSRMSRRACYQVEQALANASVRLRQDQPNTPHQD